MEPIKLTCGQCKGKFIITGKTHRRVIYQCESCGREFIVKKRPHKPSADSTT